MAMAEFLENLNWEVVQATDVQRATELCAMRRFDVIFLNQSLLEAGDENQVQAFRYAHPEGQATTIIAYQNENQPPLTNASIDREIDLFVDFPIQNNQLPVHIAVASTRRLTKNNQFRKVSQVPN